MKTRPAEVYLYEWSVLAWMGSRTRMELDAAGRGVFRELIDRCYTQGSIPKDPSLICQICSVTEGQLEEIWAKISRHFYQDKKDPSSLRNKRADAFRSDYFRYCKEQKLRRQGKTKKSEPVKTNAINAVHDGGYVAKQPETIRDDTRRNETIRDDTNTHKEPAPDLRVRPIRAADLNGKESQRWGEFLEKYPLKVELDDASRQFLSFVTVENEAEVFGCLERYMQSDQVSRGVISKPAKWLLDQHRSEWKSDWPKARDPTKTPTSADVIADIRREIREKEAKRVSQ